VGPALGFWEIVLAGAAVGALTAGLITGEWKLVGGAAYLVVVLVVARVRYRRANTAANGRDKTSKSSE
jgi:hypothetical protein